MKSFLRILVLLAVSSAVALADPTILAAQKKLQKMGFYQGDLDGEYGSQTAAAIRRYQLAENLKVTGNLTPQTLQSLGLASSTPAPKPKKAAEAPRPAATPVPEYAAIASIFKGGPFISAPTDLQIAAIREAQKNLRLLGFYNGPIDGAPTSRLVAALKAWQKDAGFRQTGRFDENTLKGLDIMPN